MFLNRFSYREKTNPYRQTNRIQKEPDLRGRDGQKRGVKMKVLRKYYYIDEDFVDDAYSTIFGYVHEEQEVVKTNETNVGGKFAIDKVIEAEAGANKNSGDTIKFNANVTASSKLQKIMDYLKSEEGEDIPYYEQLSEDMFLLKNRDDIFEGVFNVSFTKLEKYAMLVNMASSFDNVLETKQIDEEASKVFEEILEVARKEREKGLTCILHFVGSNKYPCYCRLDESFLRFPYESIQGEFTVICKISRIIQKGMTINLTDLTELSKLKMPNTNTRKGRQQQVQQIKNGKNASVKEFQDEIKGPALEIVPIAIYK